MLPDLTPAERRAIEEFESSDTPAPAPAALRRPTARHRSGRKLAVAVVAFDAAGAPDPLADAWPLIYRYELNRYPVDLDRLQDRYAALQGRLAALGRSGVVGLRELGRVEDALAYIYGILCGEARPCRWMRVSEAIRPPGG